MYVATLNFYFWEFVFKDLRLHSEGSYQLSHPPSTKRFVFFFLHYILYGDSNSEFTDCGCEF